MGKTFRKLSVLLLISALAAMAALLIFDALNHLHLTSIHKWAGALAFMLIGVSYISLQLSTIGSGMKRSNESCWASASFFGAASNFFLPVSP
jgi:hypothetical protein